MIDKTELERVTAEIPAKHLANLQKDIRKYEEHVNRCDIYETNTLAGNIGADIGFLRYTEVRTTETQKQELKNIEDQFKSHMIRLKRCRCVRKMAK